MVSRFYRPCNIFRKKGDMLTKHTSLLNSKICKTNLLIDVFIYHYFNGNMTLEVLLSLKASYLSLKMRLQKYCCMFFLRFTWKTLQNLSFKFNFSIKGITFFNTSIEENIEAVKCSQFHCFIGLRFLRKLECFNISVSRFKLHKVI